MLGMFWKGFFVGLVCWNKCVMDKTQKNQGNTKWGTWFGSLNVKYIGLWYDQ